MHDAKESFGESWRSHYALSQAEAERFWNLLAAKAGAQPHHRDGFVQYMTMQSQFPKEFRFQGDLGWGGKAYFDGHRAYVGCYVEDDTPKRDDIKRVVNEELRGLLNG